jgi:mannobiose 2-epimerase
MPRNTVLSHRQSLQQEFRRELIAIADWWLAYAQDHEQGGFYGEVDSNNRPVKNATKGIILNARILWFFSEAARELDNSLCRQCAQRAYDYLIEYFLDDEHGGFYWELDNCGRVLNDKKQVYAQAFMIYALVAYHQLTQEEQALQYALACFDLVERHAIDRVNEGYLEAFSRSWGILDDWRLSDKDLNYPKSQNTHLHILEAYTRLHDIYPTAATEAALRYNIELFDNFMIDKKSCHLRMFMDMQWQDFSPGFTYGHDIEAAWLIARALESLGDDSYRAALEPLLINIVDVTLKEALGDQGQVVDSFDFASQRVNTESVWWIQAEALVGFLYAYTVTGQSRYLAAAQGVWQFIKKYQIDHEQGEWWWFSRLEAPRHTACYKSGFWKCPYHNGRAMIEGMRMLTFSPN